MTVAAGHPPSPARAGVLRRWVPWALLGVVVVVAAVIGFHHSSAPTLAQRATNLDSRIRCPVCEGQNINQSGTPPADALKSQVRSDLEHGMSDGAIIKQITSSYGEGILERPPARGVNLLVWIVPIAVVAAAVVGLVLAFRRWRPGAVGDGSSVSVADQRLVTDALDDRAPDEEGDP